MAKNLYVGNLPFSTTEADLEGLFGQHGAVVSWCGMRASEGQASRSLCAVGVPT